MKNETISWSLSVLGIGSSLPELDPAIRVGDPRPHPFVWPNSGGRAAINGLAHYRAAGTIYPIRRVFRKEIPFVLFSIVLFHKKQ